MRSEAVNEFRTLAETRNFSQAAKRLFISQSTLSAHIKAMEQELGFDLTTHVKQGFELTPAGRLFLERSYGLLDGYREVVDECREVAKGASAKLRLSCLHMPPNSGLFAEVFANLGEDVVPYELEYHTTIVDAIRADKADIGLGLALLGYTDADDPDLEDIIGFEPLGRMSVLAAASANNAAFARADELSTALMDGRTIYVYNASYAEVWASLVRLLFGESANVRLKVVDLDNLTEYMYAPVDDGLILLPECDMRWNFRHRDDLRFLSAFDGRPMSTPYGAFFNKKRRDSRMERLLDLFRKMPPTLS